MENVKQHVVLNEQSFKFILSAYRFVKPHVIRFGAD